MGLLIADPTLLAQGELAFPARHTVAFNLATGGGSVAGECLGLGGQPKTPCGLRGGVFEAPIVVDPPRGTRTTPRMFFAWPDGRLRVPGQQCGDGLNDILITHSDDLGVTWSAPVAVNPTQCGVSGGTGVNHLGPMLGVTSDGLAVVGYRTHDDPDGTKVGTSVQLSADDGLTFSPPAGVALANSDLRFGAITLGRVMLGEYDQLAVAGHAVYLARPEPLNLNVPGETADFTFRHERIWVAKVVLPGG